MRKLLLLSALATSLLSGCGNDASEPRFLVGQQPISGGQYDQDDTSILGMKQDFGWQGEGICTATLIAPNLVITARHCVSPPLTNSDLGVICGQSPLGQPYDPSNLFFTTDMQMQNYGGTWYGSREVRTAPGGNDTCGYDVALVILSQNVPAGAATPRVPRIDSPVEIGEAYSAVGYGNTNDTSGAGVRRILFGLSAACSQGSCGYGVEASEWRGETGICSGDSGGPAIDQQGRVIGVVSRGAQGCTYPVYGSVRTWSEWIRTAAKDAAQMGGYEPPTWAVTGTTEPDPQPTPDPTPEPTPEPTPQPGSQGQACGATAGCPLGYQCYDPGDGSAFCAADCGQLACGGENTCSDISGFSLCVPSALAAGPAQATSRDSGGCSVSSADDRGPAKPVPWLLGFGLLGAVLARRRRRG